MIPRPSLIAAVYVLAFGLGLWLVSIGRTFAAWVTCMLAFSVCGFIARSDDETEEE